MARERFEASSGIMFALALLIGPSVSLCAAPERGAASDGPRSAGVMHLTLDQVKDLALENNKLLELGRLNVVEKHHVARAAKKDYFPKVLGTLTYLRFDDDLGTVLTTPGVLLPAVTVPVNVVNRDVPMATVLMVQPITKLIAVSAAVDLAKADEGIASAQLDKGTRDLLSGVTQAYYGLFAMQQIQAALKLQAGMAEPLLKANPTPELRLGALELRKGFVETEKQIAELTEQLNQLIGLAPGTTLELTEAPLPPVLVASADEAAQLALAKSPQVCEAQQNITKGRAGLRVAKMDYLPDVYVFGGWVSQGAADYIQDNFAMVGVHASIKIFEWGKRKDIQRQRETQIAMAIGNVEAVRETVQLEARKAYLAFKQAEQDLEIATETVAARQDAEKEAKALPEVLAAKAATAKAQLEQMQAEVKLRLAHTQLRAIIDES